MVIKGKDVAKAIVKEQSRDMLDGKYNSSLHMFPGNVLKAECDNNADAVKLIVAFANIIEVRAKMRYSFSSYEKIRGISIPQVSRDQVLEELKETFRRVTARAEAGDAAEKVAEEALPMFLFASVSSDGSAQRAKIHMEAFRRRVYSDLGLDGESDIIGFGFIDNVFLS